MCGVFGAIGTGARNFGEADVRRVSGSLRHRGPDDEGVYRSPSQSAVLVHRRLSIQDLSVLGHQPMTTPDGRYTIVYNGEIYNFKTLAKELEVGGTVLRSRCDTEVLLHLFAQYKERCLEKIKGMFAFAVWDELERKVFLARDRFGIKPLYWYEEGGIFFFCSELRTLKEMAPGLSVSTKAVEAYLLNGSVPAPNTFYEQIQNLEPGCWLEITQGRAACVHRWWGFENFLAKNAEREGEVLNVKISDLVGLFRERLQESVKNYLVSDVPVGVFLSGGLDSTALLSLMRTSVSRPVESVSAVFPGFAEDESFYADLAARRYGTVHHRVAIQEEDFVNQLDPFLSALDQPTVDGVNVYFISRAARQAGLKVILSGLGGDELLGGYNTYKKIQFQKKWLRIIRCIPLGSQAARIFSNGLPRDLSYKVKDGISHPAGTEMLYGINRALFTPSFLRTLGWKHRLSDRPGNNEEGPNGGGEAEVSRLEYERYLANQLLRDTDNLSMAFSLEVRVPFLDEELVRFAVRNMKGLCRPKDSKWILREAITDLPKEIAGRKKQGFGLPMRRWMLSPRAGGRIRALLLEGGLDCYFERSKIQRLWAEFERGRVHWSRPWALAVLSAWMGKSEARPCGGRSSMQVQLWATEIASYGGIQSYMRRLWETLAPWSRKNGGPCVLRSLNDCSENLWADSSLSEPGQERRENPEVMKGFGRSKRRFTLELFKTSKQPSRVIVGHLCLSLLAYGLKRLGRISDYWVVLHGVEAWQRLGLFQRMALRGADKIIATTQFTADVCAKKNGVDASRFCLLPLCAGKNTVERDAGFKLGEGFRVLSVGRHDASERYKGFDTLIEAVGRLSGKGADIRLHLVGDGNDQDTLKRLVREKGLEKRVILWGALDPAKLEAAYQQCDVYAMPSRKEGFGIVFLEAMRHAKPCIGGRHGGTPEVIRDGVTGFLVEYGDVSALEKYLSGLAQNPELVERLGKAGQSVYESSYTFSVFSQRVGDLLKETAGGC